jgi:hypothetical protein
LWPSNPSCSEATRPPPSSVLAPQPGQEVRGGLRWCATILHRVSQAPPSEWRERGHSQVLGAVAAMAVQILSAVAGVEWAGGDADVEAGSKGRGALVVGQPWWGWGC